MVKKFARGQNVQRKSLFMFEYLINLCHYLFSAEISKRCYTAHFYSVLKHSHLSFLCWATKTTCRFKCIWGPELKAYKSTEEFQNQSQRDFHRHSLNTTIAQKPLWDLKYYLVFNSLSPIWCIFQETAVFFTLLWLDDSPPVASNEKLNPNTSKRPAYILNLQEA